MEQGPPVWCSVPKSSLARLEARFQFFQVTVLYVSYGVRPLRDHSKRVQLVANLDTLGRHYLRKNFAKEVRKTTSHVLGLLGSLTSRFSATLLWNVSFR